MYIYSIQWYSHYPVRPCLSLPELAGAIIICNLFIQEGSAELQPATDLPCSIALTKTEMPFKSPSSPSYSAGSTIPPPHEYPEPSRIPTAIQRQYTIPSLNIEILRQREIITTTTLSGKNCCTVQSARTKEQWSTRNLSVHPIRRLRFFQSQKPDQRSNIINPGFREDYCDGLCPSGSDDRYRPSSGVGQSTPRRLSSGERLFFGSGLHQHIILYTGRPEPSP